MRFREWLHPHRQLLLALVAVAVVSAGALGWLGWLLVQQDAAMARRQETDRLQQQAEMVAAALRASLADLPRLAGASNRGVLVVAYRCVARGAHHARCGRAG